MGEEPIKVSSTPRDLMQVPSTLEEGKDIATSSCTSANIHLRRCLSEENGTNNLWHQTDDAKPESTMDSTVIRATKYGISCHTMSSQEGLPHLIGLWELITPHSGQVWVQDVKSKRLASTSEQSSSGSMLLGRAEQSEVPRIGVPLSLFGNASALGVLADQIETIKGDIDQGQDLSFEHKGRTHQQGGEDRANPVPLSGKKILNSWTQRHKRFLVNQYLMV